MSYQAGRNDLFDWCFRGTSHSGPGLRNHDRLSTLSNDVSLNMSEANLAKINDNSLQNESDGDNTSVSSHSGASSPAASDAATESTELEDLGDHVIDCNISFTAGVDSTNKGTQNKYWQQSSHSRSMSRTIGEEENSQMGNLYNYNYSWLLDRYSTYYKVFEREEFYTAMSLYLANSDDLEFINSMHSSVDGLWATTYTEDSIYEPENKWIGEFFIFVEVTNNIWHRILKSDVSHEFHERATCNSRNNLYTYDLDLLCSKLEEERIRKLNKRIEWKRQYNTKSKNQGKELDVRWVCRKLDFVKRVCAPYETYD